MAASVQCRPHDRTMGMVMKEVDEDLAMFLEMRRSEKEMNDHLLTCNPEILDQPLGSQVDCSMVSNGTSTRPAIQAAGDYFLSSECDKTDYDWLLSSPHTAINPSLEAEEQNTAVCQIMSDSSSTALDCEVETGSGLAAPESIISSVQGLAQPANSLEESSSQINSTGQAAMSTGKNSAAGKGKPLSSGGKKATASRSATPTGRPRSSASKPSRSSTPTSRAGFPSVKPVASTARSSTPTRAAPRSSTPTSRASFPAASKATSRSATSTPATIPIISMSSSRSSSATKAGTTTLKKAAPSRGTSPTVKSRSLKPSETLSLSRDASTIANTSVPKRPASASRGRPASLVARPSASNSSSGGKPRQKSCSPSRGRAANTTFFNNGSTLLSKSRGHLNDNDYVNPVLMGTKMVERVVNMRKLAPPKQDDNLSHDNPTKKSSSSQESSGFGRSFSKKSLDMAIRHMDIRRSVNETLRPVLTRGSASSANGIRFSSTKNKTGSVSDSPLATSSNASSEPSVNNSSNNIEGSEPEYSSFGSEREQSSPTSQQHLDE